MTDERNAKPIATGRIGRLASMARAGLGTAASVMTGSSAGVEKAVDRLAELRGLGTKVGQMAGLVEASLAPDVRAKVGPALAKLRDRAARSDYEHVARTIEDELGAPPSELFARFEPEPFASASLGQVHDATHPDGRRLAVKVQHPGIEDAFRHDLENVTSLGRIATSFMMPDGQGAAFIDGVKSGFLAELDYEREAENLRTFEALVAGDPDLEVPSVADDRSSARVLSTRFLEGASVESARAFDTATRRRQAAAIRRFVVSSLADHGLLYADAHAGNFLFRPDGTVGVLDFGSVFRFDDERRRGFGELRDALARGDRPAVGHVVGPLFGIENPKVVDAIAEMQWIAWGGIVRGEAIDDGHVRAITAKTGELKKRLFGERFALPFFMPFLMRTALATNALLAALRAPESGTLGAPRLARPREARVPPRTGDGDSGRE